MLGYHRAELLDMDAYLRVDAAYAYWCKVRRSYSLSYLKFNIWEHGFFLNFD